MSKRQVSITVDGNVIAVQEEQIEKFQAEIENLVLNGGMTYIEAVSHYCELANIDIVKIKNLLSTSLMAKIHSEALNNNLINETTGQLPL